MLRSAGAGVGYMERFAPRYPKICSRYAQYMPKISPSNTQDIPRPKICPRYPPDIPQAQNMPKIFIDNPKISPRYARYIPEISPIRSGLVRTGWDPKCRTGLYKLDLWTKRLLEHFLCPYPLPTHSSNNHWVQISGKSFGDLPRSANPSYLHHWIIKHCYHCQVHNHIFLFIRLSPLK